jgi:hypothetical protein
LLARARLFVSFSYDGEKASFNIVLRERNEKERKSGPGAIRTHGNLLRRQVVDPG